MESNAWKLIHHRLLGLRESHGAVARFCERSGLPRQTVEYWLKHGTVPNLDKIDQIAAGFGVEPRDLFSDLSPAWREIVRKVGDVDETQVPAIIAGIRGALAGLRLDQAESLVKGADKLARPPKR